MQRNRKSRIWRVLIITVVTLVIDFIIISVAALVMSNSYVRNYIENDVYVQQARVQNSLDEIIYEVFVTHERIFTNENNEKIRLSSNLEEDFPAIVEDTSINKMIFAGITLYNNGNQYKTDPLLQDLLAADIEKVSSSTNELQYIRTFPEADANHIVFGRDIRGSENVGTIFYYLNLGVFEDVIGALAGEVAYSNITTSSGQVVISEKDYTPLSVDTKLETPTYSIKRINRVTTVRAAFPLNNLEKSYGLEWQIISYIPYNVLFSELTNLQILIFAIAVVVLVVSLIFSIAFGRRLVKPIKQLSTKMSDYSPDEKFIPTIEVEDDEIAQLEASYNEMIERINNLIIKNQDDAEIKRKLELDSLQQQINPHFLYNTLDAIAWMAKLKKEPEIESLVLSLAKFFRISLHKGDKFITVEEEIELVKHFVDIELIRFPDKFTIVYNVDEEVKNYQTLKIIIQPIVENAIKHGISSLEDMGHISINAYLDEGDVVYEIIDDGIGFNPPADLFTKKDPYQQTKSGFGLYNVNERIKLEYGHDYGVSVESKPQEGTKITIRIEGRI